MQACVAGERLDNGIVGELVGVEVTTAVGVDDGALEVVGLLEIKVGEAELIVAGFDTDVFGAEGAVDGVMELCIVGACDLGFSVAVIVAADGNTEGIVEVDGDAEGILVTDGEPEVAIATVDGAFDTPATGTIVVFVVAGVSVPFIPDDIGAVVELPVALTAGAALVKVFPVVPLLLLIDAAVGALVASPDEVGAAVIVVKGNGVNGAAVAAAVVVLTPDAATVTANNVMLQKFRSHIGSLFKRTA
jgi:hypothetical protein